MYDLKAIEKDQLLKIITGGRHVKDKEQKLSLATLDTTIVPQEEINPGWTK